MSKTSLKLKKKLLNILRDEYEECSFFIAASSTLTGKIADLAEHIDKDSMDFNSLRDRIGEIGLFISNTEKRLEDVEECYTKLVDALSENRNKKS